ncbi:carboxypeptidase regulatory-like domain-containing protein [Halorubrum sp. Boch-26]|uniref:carboxypeptidase regulatory-like domain-containing protein n=1 Tax=Halorubrum sp. Boch-26 TaxID=2994426 RepID=UPI0024691582|nr:carboxypeptidase regulatory-like domain-containing protein [Halorubrum sp. Boch-26]
MTRDRAQSTTVGTILLVAVFLVVAATVGVAVVDDVTPDEEPLVSAEFDADGTDLSISHIGGNSLGNADLRLFLDSGGNTTQIEFNPPPDERFSPGDRREFGEVLTPASTTRIRLVHIPSGTVLDEGTVTAGAGPVETGAIGGTVTERGSSSIRASGASFALRQVLTPLDGVSVTVSGPSDTTTVTTGPNGAYRVEGLEPGTYEVSTSPVDLGAASVTAVVEANETATADLVLDPPAPAEFAVTIDDADAEVNAGEPVVVNATIENVGGESGTQTVELTAGGATVDSASVTLAGGESRRISLAWQTLPSDVGDTELAVASEDDAATTTVEVLDADTEAVAYVDRDEDGGAEELFTTTDLAFLSDLDGHFVVFDDASVPGSMAVDADRVTVEDGVTLDAVSIDLAGRDGVSLGDGATLDASSERLAGAAAGDITVRSGGDLDAAGVTATTAARALFGASGGDIDVSAAGDVDVSQGDFDATSRAWISSGDGTIRIASDDGTVIATGARFDPDPTIESNAE